MKIWLTQIEAIDPNDGELKIWAGPKVFGITLKFAELYAEQNGLGYCKIIGEFITSVPCKSDSALDDLGNRLDYDCGLN